MGAFETANDGRSMLTDAFSNDDLAVLDYMEDLDSYWKYLYAYELNYKSTCSIISKMLQAVRNDVGWKVANFRFGHFEVVTPLLAAFDLFKDSVDVFERPAYSIDHFKNRQYRGSVASPFATNMALLKFECPNDRNDPKMAIVVNGKLLKKPTSIQEIEQSMPWAFNCDAESICRL